MSLSLKILSIKGEPVTEEPVAFDEGGSIGRSGNNTLVLPDPDKFVSRTHAVISAENQQYVLKDLSLSGTFIDQSSQPLKKQSQVLANGMVLRIGNYQVLVSIDENERDESWADFDSDAFPPPPKKEDPSLLGDGDGLPSCQVDDDNELNKLLDNPVDSPFASLSDSPQDSFESLVNANLSPLHDSFTPPSVERPEPPASDAAEEIPEDFNFEELFESGSSHQGTGGQAETAPALSDFAPPENAGHDSGLCKSFLQGAGLDESLMNTDNAGESMQRIGEMFRKLVEGTMGVLKARAELKNMFRVNQTYIKTHDNNALKFSTSTNEALSYLISNTESGFKDSLEAIDEGFDDIMLHQLAMQAGIQAALDEMLKQFDPQWIETQFEDSLLLQKKSKCWEKYAESYPQLKAQAQDNFFGEAFAKAYETQITRLKQARK